MMFFVVILFVFHNKNEADYSQNSSNNVSDNYVIHNYFSFNKIILLIKNDKEKRQPQMKTGMLTVPEAPGIKNPMTEEANNILDKSAQNLEMLSTCNLFSLNGINAIHGRLSILV